MRIEGRTILVLAWGYSQAEIAAAVGKGASVDNRCDDVKVWVEIQNKPMGLL